MQNIILFLFVILLNKSQIQMDVAQIKEELHSYIDDADDRLIKLIYGLVLADKVSDDIPDWHKKIVEERLEAYERNPDDVVTWEELKSRVADMR